MSLPPSVGSRSWPTSIVMRVAALVVCGLAAIWLGWLQFSPDDAVAIVRLAGYPVSLATTVLLGWAVARAAAWREVPAKWKGGGWKPGLVIIGVSALLHVQEPHGFKVVNDELVLFSTSQRLHFEREAATVDQGYSIGREFVLMHGHVDKRPLLFPFLVATLHDLTGYRVENAFVLNALLTPVLFGLLHLVGRTIGGTAAGVGAVLLLATIPLVTQTVTGGGFETLNLVMILLTLLLGMRLVSDPQPHLLSAFCLSGVLLAQVRYESVLFIFPVAIVTIAVVLKTRSQPLPWPVVISPLLLVLVPLQWQVFALDPAKWQLASRSSEHGLFSLSYFADNIAHALHHFFAWDRSQPNSPLVALGGIVGLVLLAVHVFRWIRERRFSWNAASVLGVFLAALVVHGLLMLCYFWGVYDDVITARLSLPTQLLFTLVIIVVLSRMPGAHRRWRVLSWVSVFFIALWTLPTLARRAYATGNLAAETCNWYREYLREREDRRFFVVEPRMPLLWIAHGVPSITYETLAERTTGFIEHYRRGTFGECLVVQKLVKPDFATGELAPLAPFDFGRAVTLETVREIRFNPTYAVRISRVVDVDEAALLAWAATADVEIDDSRPANASDPQYQVQKARFTRQWMQQLP